MPNTASIGWCAPRTQRIGKGADTEAFATLDLTHCHETHYRAAAPRKERDRAIHIILSSPYSEQIYVFKCQNLSLRLGLDWMAQDVPARRVWHGQFTREPRDTSSGARKKGANLEKRSASRFATKQAVNRFSWRGIIFCASTRNVCPASTNGRIPDTARTSSASGTHGTVFCPCNLPS